MGRRSPFWISRMSSCRRKYEERFATSPRTVPSGFSARKIAELGQVIDRVSRDEILSIAVRRKRTRGSEAQMAQGAVGGFLLTMVGASGGGTGPNFCTEHPNGCWPAIAT